MGKQKKEGGSNPASTSGNGNKKPSDLNYKLTMRWESNKKKRAARHAKRMKAQAEKCLERYNLGKPISSKLKRKLDFNASMVSEP